MPENGTRSLGRWVAKSVPIIVLLVGIGLIAFLMQSQHQKEAETVTLIVGTETAPGLLQKNQGVGRIVGAQFRSYRTNATAWSFAYHGTLFFSAFLSVMATLILKLETWPAGWDDKKRKDHAAVFAAFGGLMITISTAGDFQGKWQANRMAAARSASLAYELLKKDEPPPPQDVLVALQDIVLSQNESIISENRQVAVDVQKSKAAQGTSADKEEPKPVKPKAGSETAKRL